MIVGDGPRSADACRAEPRPEITDRPEGTGTFKIEADVKLLMYVTAFAVNLTRQGWQLYDQRCQPPS